MTGRRISTARGRETEKFKKEWQDKLEKSNNRNRKIFGPSFKSFDDIGEPIFSDRSPSRSMRGPEFVKALERALAATGDPVFDDALRALRSYGLDKGGHGKIHRRVWGDYTQGALQQVRYEVDKIGLSVPSAAEKITALLNLPGSSFEAIVQDLSKAFRAWKKAGYPPQEIEPEIGDLGYVVEVGGINDETFTALSKILSNKSRVQPSTLYWRRIARDGSVTLRFVGEN